MPFKNEAQRRACWAQYNRDLKAGRTPAWDCHTWAHEGAMQGAGARYGAHIDGEDMVYGNRVSSRRGRGGSRSGARARRVGRRSTRRSVGRRSARRSAGKRRSVGRRRSSSRRQPRDRFGRFISKR